MKRVLYCLVTIVVLAGLMVGTSAAMPNPPTPTPAPKKIVLTAVTNFPLTNYNVDGFVHWAELVNKRAKGELEVVIKGGPEVVTAKESLPALEGGMIDVLHFKQIGGPAISLATDCAPVDFDTCFDIWRDKEFLSLMDKFYREKHNTVVLGDAGNTNLFHIGTTKKPVSKLEDLKGLRIRSHGGAAAVAVKKLGATAVKVPTAEVYIALQRGVVDGALRPLKSMFDLKEYEIIRHVVRPHVFQCTSMILINQDAWNKLPTHSQNLLTDAVIEMGKWAHAYYARFEKETVGTLQDKGVKFHSLSTEELSRWRGMLGKPLEDWYIKLAGPAGGAVLDIVKKYQK